MRKKRDLFAELAEGFDAPADRREGKRTLRTQVVNVKPAPKITARELARLGKRTNPSRGLFAGQLRTNVRTLENREQVESGSAGEGDRELTESLWNLRAIPKSR